MKRINRNYYVRNFHQAKWDEPVIFELSQKGERGVLLPKADEIMQQVAGDGTDSLPESMRRKTPPALPEMAQPRVLRHYMRLSQETLGGDVNIEIGQGTCTVKYNPKINDRLAALPEMTALHPEQPLETVQGILQIMHETDLMMREISGMDRFTFQTSSGSQAAFAMASLIKAWHRHTGEDAQRDEIITTVFSHPSDAACPALKGYKIITIMPDEDGYPDYEAFKAAVSERTAGFICANPEDTGIYNKRIQAFTRLVHEKGGLCGYDQANANGLLGVTRAREAGFDMCFFNLHKTFGTPHGCGGPGSGALGVVKKLEDFLPAPLIDHDGETYVLRHDLPHSIGRVRSFNGVAQVVLKAYAWIRSLGAEGLYEAAKVAVLNNNYLYRKLLEVDGIEAPFDPEKQRIEQVRFTLKKVAEDTGVTTGDIQRRMLDFGLHYWTSHHPYYVPEPATLEPTETPSKEELDEYIATLAHVVREAYENPELVKTAPHNSVTHLVDESGMDDPEGWAITWRSYLKKTSQQS
jgi:glycine dehydrogenase subunit 2